MGFLRALTEALAVDLAAKVPTLAKVYPEWPEANQQLVFPSASIETQQPQYERCAPYLLTQGATANNIAATTYVVGSYTIPLQLDVWTKYKIQRDALYELLFQVLQPTKGEGYCLQLAAYYNQFVSFTMRNYKLMDDTESVRQKAWRVMFLLEASCRAVNGTNDFIITQVPVLQLSTPDTIP